MSCIVLEIKEKLFDVTKIWRQLKWNCIIRWFNEDNLAHSSMIPNLQVANCELGQHGEGGLSEKEKKNVLTFDLLIEADRIAEWQRYGLQHHKEWLV